MENICYNFSLPPKIEHPILISAPHVGVLIPPKIGEIMTPEALTLLKDTDWIVDQLYSFAYQMGIPILSARYSRYVVDLNRPIRSERLYDDGRKETTLFPEYDFDGNQLYQEGRYNKDDFHERVKLYYEPYHEKIGSELESMQEKFGKALLIEAHSIRRFVPSLHPKPFPDLILGNQNHKTCPKSFMKTAKEQLVKNGFGVAINDPFMGGYITRKFADPKRNIFTLQLEKSQDLYLNQNHKLTSEAAKLIGALKHMISALAKELSYV